MLKWLANENATRENESHKDLYIGSLFLMSYIQSFAQLCKDFTKINKFTYKYTTKIQSWTLQDWFYPYAKPYHIRWSTLLQLQYPTAVYYANLQHTNEITKNFTTNYTQTIFKYNSTKEHMIFKLQYSISQHNNQKPISIYKESLIYEENNCWMLSQSNASKIPLKKENQGWSWSNLDQPLQSWM